MAGARAPAILDDGLRTCSAARPLTPYVQGTAASPRRGLFNRDAVVPGPRFRLICWLAVPLNDV